MLFGKNYVSSTPQKFNLNNLKMKKILVSLLVMVVLVSCGGGSGSVKGKWVLADIELDLESLPEEQKAMAGMMTGMLDAMKGNMHYDIKEDGTYSMTVNMMGQENTESGKWSEAGGKLTFEKEDGASESMDYECSGSSLVLKQEKDGMSMEMAFDAE